MIFPFKGLSHSTRSCLSDSPRVCIDHLFLLVSAIHQIRLQIQQSNSLAASFLYLLKPICLLSTLLSVSLATYHSLLHLPGAFLYALHANTSLLLKTLTHLLPSEPSLSPKASPGPHRSCLYLLFSYSLLSSSTECHPEAACFVY